MKKSNLRIIIFGSGRYYEKYKRYLSSNEVECIIDNDARKQNTVKDGLRVISPETANFLKCDYVIIMVKNVEDIRLQLNQLGVENSRIRTFDDIFDLSREDYVISNSRHLLLEEWLDLNQKNKRILVVSNGLSRTGVPIALMNISILLKKMSYSVLYASLEVGELEEELCNNGVDYIPCLEQYLVGDLHESLSRFTLIILGTADLFRVSNSFFQCDTPIIWWMHESLDMYYKEMQLPEEYSRVSFYGVGNRVINTFHRFFPDRNMALLPYYLPDYFRRRQERNEDETVFAIIGLVSQRKGQDIGLSAWESLSCGFRKKARLLIVGKVSLERSEEFYELIKNDSSVVYLGEVDSQEIQRLYSEEIDVLVAPSRDDPMPIVVTEAMQNEIPCIISDEVGQAEFAKGQEGILVFHNEDVEELRRCFEYCIENKEKLTQMGTSVRYIYEEFFSEEKAKKNLCKILADLIR